MRQWKLLEGGIFKGKISEVRFQRSDALITNITHTTTKAILPPGGFNSLTQLFLTELITLFFGELEVLPSTLWQSGRLFTKKSCAKELNFVFAENKLLLIENKSNTTSKGF